MLYHRSTKQVKIVTANSYEHCYISEVSDLLDGNKIEKWNTQL